MRQKAEAAADENFDFRDFLKHRTSLSSGEVDRLVFKISDEVWQRTDCTACANCCREVRPMLDEKDVERLARHLGLNRSEFVSTYLQPAESPGDIPWVMRERPCPFLKDNQCSVYEQRPDTCREYPYLHKPDFTARTLSMIGRLSECPAVNDVWDQLKRATGFSRR